MASGTRLGDTVAVVVRPETIIMSRPGGEAEAPAAQVLAGQVLQSAYLGTSVSHRVQTDKGVTVTVVVPRSHERYASGDPVRIRWIPNDAKVLARTIAPQEEATA